MSRKRERFLSGLYDEREFLTYADELFEHECSGSREARALGELAPGVLVIGIYGLYLRERQSEAS